MRTRPFLLFLAGLSLSVPASASGWNGRVLDVTAGAWIDEAALLDRAASMEIVVIGEKHYTTPVQSVESRIVQGLAERVQGIALGWEFLSASQQEHVDSGYERFRESKISGQDFLNELFGAAGPSHSVYLPLLEAARAVGASLHALNLSRAEKAPVVRDGIGALDPSLLPPGFALGGTYYRERFEEIMGGHASPERLQNYFEAQCLTDDVMAWNLLEKASSAVLRVMVAGSFHTDYFDGAVARLRARSPESRLLSVRIFDASDSNEGELQSIARHPKYGAIADYIYFVNEPRDSRAR